MNSITLKKITPFDIVELQVIAKKTFRETFTESNTEEDMQHYLTNKLSIETLLKELNNQNSETYFANLNNQVVGYLKLNFADAQTEIQDPFALEVERIYVLKSFQNKKIGQLLLESAISKARSKRLKYIWLGVWEHNTKAIQFYEKNGFYKFDEHVFLLGSDQQRDHLMKLEI